MQFFVGTWATGDLEIKPTIHHDGNVMKVKNIA